MSALPADDWRRIAIAKARRLGLGPDDAEDLAHEAILKVWRHIERYPTAGDVARVTVAAVANHYKDQRKGRAGRDQVLPLPPSAALPATDQDAAMDGAALLRWCFSHCANEQDRATILAWAWGITPMEQVARWPHLFPNASAVYNSRHRLGPLLRRRKQAELAVAAD